MGRHAISLIGQRFGKLLVQDRAASRPQGGGRPRWVCLCDCGNIIEVPGARLTGGSNKSCGCFRRDRMGELFKTHGKSKTMEYCMFYDARKRAIDLNLPFDLEPTDIIIPTTCPVLGIQLLLKGDRNNRPSLDRKIPSLGYVKTNIHVISFRANRYKSDANVDEIRRLLAYMEST